MQFYMLLCVIVTSASTVASDNVTSEGDTQRFYDFIDNNGVTHVIDTEAKSAPFNETDSSSTKYILFTKRNPKDGQYLNMEDLGSISNSNYNPDVITVVLVHGWRDSSDSIAITTIRDPLLKTSDVNVIAYDWSVVADMDYFTAVDAVPTLGAQLGRFLARLIELTNALYDNLHLIGHSLGAHLTGCAGKNLDGKAARFTALDPAGPLWYKNPNQVKSTDAKYVEVMHTNAGGLGIRKVLGDVDIFPNGGGLQPDCLSPSCAHARAWELFAATLEHIFTGYKCSSLLNMDLNKCSAPTLEMGNNDVKKSGFGIYRFKTSGKYPYQIRSNSTSDTNVLNIL